MTNNNRVTINANAFFLNLAKGWQVSGQDPTLVSSDGYPLSASTVMVGNMPLPSAYFDMYYWSWSGTASMQLLGPTAIVYTGGAFTGLGTDSGQITANFGIINQTNPAIQFKFGALIS